MRKNTEDTLQAAARRIVRDVMEDLFHGKFLDHTRWLGIEENKLWAQGWVIEALTQAGWSPEGPQNAAPQEDWMLSYEDWKQGVGPTERYAWVLESVPAPYVGLRWMAGDKHRVVHTIENGRVHLETEGSNFAYLFDSEGARQEIARDIYNTYGRRYEQESQPPAPAPAPAPAPVSTLDYPWAKTDIEKGRIRKQLGTRVNVDGNVITMQELIDGLLAKGATLTITFGPSKLTRTSHNRMVGREFIDWERRQVERGLQPTYYLQTADSETFYGLNKMQFDYAHHAAGKPKVETRYEQGYLSNRAFQQAKKKAQEDYPQWLSPTNGAQSAGK